MTTKGVELRATWPVHSAKTLTKELENMGKDEIRLSREPFEEPKPREKDYAKIEAYSFKILSNSLEDPIHIQITTTDKTLLVSLPLKAFHEFYHSAYALRKRSPLAGT
jgi:hypothetical protein